jgi:hypothetical protein
VTDGAWVTQLSPIQSFLSDEPENCYSASLMHPLNATLNAVMIPGLLAFASLCPYLAAQTPPRSPAEEKPLSNLKLIEVLPLAATLHHVQGIDMDGNKLWVTSVDRVTSKGYLHLLELPTGKLLREVEVQQGSCFHPGGISLGDASVWLPVAEYRRDSRSTIQRRDRNTLALMNSFQVEDHIGCLAIGPDFLVGGNWDSRTFYFWDRSGKLLEKRENPHRTAYQDMKIVDGLLVASGALPGQDGTIDWLDRQTLHLRRSIKAGATDRGVRFSNEGMTIRKGKLYLLPEDGPSRLFVFRLSQQ